MNIVPCENCGRLICTQQVEISFCASCKDDDSNEPQIRKYKAYRENMPKYSKQNGLTLINLGLLLDIEGNKICDREYNVLKTSYNLYAI